MRTEPWSILLAGGEGRRLKGVTLDAEGRHLPKQFCSIAPGPTLLASALERAAAVTPLEKTLPVVLERHRPWWTPELQRVPPENIHSQPHDRGTGPAVLLALLTIVERDPEASVVILPSDHFIEREAVFRRAVESTLEDSADRITLFAAAPRDPEADLGWILPKQLQISGPSPVESFVEKPDRDHARELQRQGALVNTMVLTGRAADLLDVYRDVAPEQLEILVSDTSRPRRSSEEALADAYSRMARMDFSRDLLERAASRHPLWVLRLPACGWSDLGTPERLRAVRDRLGWSTPTVAGLPEPPAWRYGSDYWLG